MENHGSEEDGASSQHQTDTWKSTCPFSGTHKDSTHIYRK